MTINENWKLQPVAEGQLAVVQRQLRKNFHDVPPFEYFLRAMNDITGSNKSTLLDVGCGVGTYGVLCRTHFPQVEYTGTDFSPAMIQIAKTLCPEGHFEVRKFEDNAFGDFDIILASQVVEYTADPWRSMEMLRERLKKFLILHRLRLTIAASQPLEEATYAGQIATTFLWNLHELLSFWVGPDRVVTHYPWDGDLQATIIVERT